MDTAIHKLDAAKRDVPIRIANIARRYFVGSWDRQGFDGVKWKEVQRRIPGTKAYKYPKTTQLSRRTNPILIGTYKGRSGGRLRREANNSIREANWNEIRLGISDVTPYAKYINEGTPKMARRKYMGSSVELKRAMKAKIQSELKKIF